MPRTPRPHPAFAAMLAESQRTGMPHAFTRDLTVHDHAWIEKRDPKLPFLWCLRIDGTHTVALEPVKRPEHGRDSAPAIFDSLVRGWPGARFYIWNGVSLQSFKSTEAARAGMLDLIEREAQAARELAAKFCQSNPATPHEWRGAKCTFCEVPKPRET